MAAASSSRRDPSCCPSASRCSASRRTCRSITSRGPCSASAWRRVSTMLPSRPSAACTAPAARPSISGLTLIAASPARSRGRSSPLSRSGRGWRGACLALAGGSSRPRLPLHLSLPAPPLVPTAPPAAAERRATPGSAVPDRRFLLLAVALTLYALVASGLSVHILEILRSFGMTAAAAIGRRRSDRPVSGRRAHSRIRRRRPGPPDLGRARRDLSVPCWYRDVAAHGSAAGDRRHRALRRRNGILTIARGTLPLALFGPARLWRAHGRHRATDADRPGAGPVIFAELLQRGGPVWPLAIATGLTAVSVTGFCRLRPAP